MIKAAHRDLYGTKLVRDLGSGLGEELLKAMHRIDLGL